MLEVSKLASEIIKKADEDLQPGWERITIILKSDDFKKLKTISDVKKIFIKDIVSGLIEIYNRVAITDKDKENIEEEKIKLEEEIKKLVQIQEDISGEDISEEGNKKEEHSP